MNMNLATLESIVGPINRGQLATKFKPTYEAALEDEPEFFNDDRRMARPELEDLSYLNSPTTKKYSELAKKVWKNLTPEARRSRMRHLAKVGKVGGSATKDMRHLHGS